MPQTSANEQAPKVVTTSMPTMYEHPLRLLYTCGSPAGTFFCCLVKTMCAIQTALSCETTLLQVEHCRRPAAKSQRLFYPSKRQLFPSKRRRLPTVGLSFCETAVFQANRRVLFVSLSAKRQNIRPVRPTAPPEVAGMSVCVWMASHSCRSPPNQFLHARGTCNALCETHSSAALRSFGLKVLCSLPHVLHPSLYWESGSSRCVVFCVHCGTGTAQHFLSFIRNA